MPITHTDGAQYFSQAEIDVIVQNRVKAKDETIDAHAAKIKSFEPQLAQLQTITAERDTWKTKAETEAARFSRYQAAAAHGITDPDTIEVLETAHTKAMARVEEAKRTDFGGYLNAVKADPTLAPAWARGLFQAQPGATGQPAGQGAGQGAQNPQQGQPAGQPAGQPQGQEQQVVRPAWAPAGEGQRTVTPGQTPELTQRISGAKSLDELQAIQDGRRRTN